MEGEERGGPAAAASTAPATDDLVAAAAERANPLEELAPAASPEASAPANKLHEWAAAAAIMLLMAGLLFAMLSLFRGGL